MAHVRELGYVAFEVSDLDAWTTFARELLGMEVVRDGDRTLLRMDDRAYRVELEEGPADDLVRQGYDCTDDATLDALVADLAAAGHETEHGSADLAARRRVRRLAIAHDPMGNRVELYVGLGQGAPADTGATASGFQTDLGGAGHMVLNAADRQAALDFYGILGFTVSDYVQQEVAPGFVLDAVFTHCNGRHHTLAFADIPVPKRIQHFMVEVNSFEDVGRAWDRVVRRRLAPVTLTLGVHPNDQMFSFYVRTPSGFEWEYGTGGLIIHDESSWEVRSFEAVSVWGHIPAPILAEALTPPA